jgi:hypothetical protein
MGMGSDFSHVCPNSFWGLPGLCAIVQVASHQLLTAAGWVQSQISSCGFVVDKVSLWQVFSEYFGFPYHFSHAIWGGTYQGTCFHPTLIIIIVIMMMMMIIINLLSSGKTAGV